MSVYSRRLQQTRFGRALATRDVDHIFGLATGRRSSARLLLDNDSEHSDRPWRDPSSCCAGAVLSVSRPDASPWSRRLLDPIPFALAPETLVQELDDLRGRLLGRPFGYVELRYLPEPLAAARARFSLQDGSGLVASRSCRAHLNSRTKKMDNQPVGFGVDVAGWSGVVAGGPVSGWFALGLGGAVLGVDWRSPG